MWLRRFVPLFLILSLVGCSTAYRRSVGATQEIAYSRVYLADMVTSWIAVTEALKSFRLDVLNQAGGYLQTRWTDNTVERNAAEPLGGTGVYLKAQYRFKVNLAPVYVRGRGQGIKISVLKEQWVQRDVLEGWRPAESDATEENTLLYRIGRLIAIRLELDRLEKEKTERELREFQATTDADSGSDLPTSEVDSSQVEDENERAPEEAKPARKKRTQLEDAPEF